jgi:hypothetical protein
MVFLAEAVAKVIKINEKYNIYHKLISKFLYIVRAHVRAFSIDKFHFATDSVYLGCISS